MEKEFIKIIFRPGDEKKLYFFPERNKNVIRYASEKMYTMMAEEFLTAVRKGLRNNGLGLQKLERSTIRKKIALGYPRPYVPLYGKGDTDDKSIYSLIRIRKNPNSLSVGFQGNTRHHLGRLTIGNLMTIHANGFPGLPKRNPIKAGLERFNYRESARRIFKEVMSKK
jgi:hypothetical protein